MYKKELRSLKRINATPHMRRVAQRNKLAVPIKCINSWGTYKRHCAYAGYTGSRRLERHSGSDTYGGVA